MLPFGIDILDGLKQLVTTTLKETLKNMKDKITTNATDDIKHDVIDIEEYAKKGEKPPKAKRYQIRIDKQKYTVEVHSMTGRELLTLAGKTPVTSYMISQKLHGGEAREIGLDESADFTAPGVERFMTLKLNHTDGGN